MVPRSLFNSADDCKIQMDQLCKKEATIINRPAQKQISIHQLIKNKMFVCFVCLILFYYCLKINFKKQINFFYFLNCNPLTWGIFYNDSLLSVSVQSLERDSTVYD